MTFGLHYLAEILPDFLTAYPEIELDLSLEDRAVDLVGEGFDATLRVRTLDDSSLVARKLAPVRMHVVATPDYWRRHGVPKTPEDLQHHDCFTYANMPDSSVWRFARKDGETRRVRVRSRLAYNNADVIASALCAGLGVCWHPDFICWRDLRDGRLESVLDDWCAQEMWLHLLTPSSKGSPRKTRVFSDFVHGRFGAGKAPWLAVRKGERQA